MKYLDVNGILDVINNDDTIDVEAIYANPPEGDDSDGNNNSDIEDGDGASLSRNILKVCLHLSVLKIVFLVVKTNCIF